MANTELTYANHYVKNSELYDKLVIYLNNRKEGKVDRANEDYIGKSVYTIAEKYTNKSNLRNYFFKEEMIADAVENCFRYIHNFNPEKYKNPFAYFTTIIHYAMMRRIEKEKKYLYTKYANIKNVDLFDIANRAIPMVDSMYDHEQIYQALSTQENMNEFMSNFEERRKEKIKKRKESKENGTKDNP